MGVPVVTLVGKTAAGRAGVSILSTVGLPEMIAHDENQFVEIVTRLSNDGPGSPSFARPCVPGPKNRR